MIWLPVLFGCIFPDQHMLCGVMGFEINDFLNSFIGKLGVILLLIVSLIIYCVIHFRVTYETLQEKWKNAQSKKKLNE